MQEMSVSEIVKYFLLLCLVMLTIFVAIFCIQLQDINTFKQNVNYTIEREGGLTDQAVTKINTDSKKNYHDRFTISSDKLGKELPFGESVDYVVTQHFKFNFFKKFEFSIPSRGSAVSQIRAYNNE